MNYRDSSTKKDIEQHVTDNISVTVDIESIKSIITTVYEPEDIFTYDALKKWAENNGFVLED